MTGQQQAGDQSRRSLTGFVTKLVGDEATYGFINDEIFFQQAVVSGSPALVGDQVFAECEYSAHLPIKWNATSVKILRRAQNNSNNNSNQQPIDQQQQQQFQQSAGQYGQQQQHQAGRMLDQTGANQDLYNNQASSRLLPPPPPISTPISEQQPVLPAMGPASLAYTSQLGSAFVQNQPFVAPTPFIAQQQQPVQMMPHQQNMLPQNQRNQNNHNKGGFQNQGHDNTRMNRRNDRRRSNDRDNNNSQRNNNRNNNNNNSNNNFRDNHTRDRSSGGSNQNKGRSNDRQSAPTRASPPAHLTSSRASSTSSDKNKSNKKTYEIENIPKTEILNEISVSNIKQRCSSSVHVPSDLKDIIVNKHFRLDLKNIPKPIKYNIEQSQAEPAKTEPSNDNADATTSSTESKPTEDVVASTQAVQVSSATSTTGSCTSETSRSADVLPTPPTSKSDIRLNHKYGVKVLLISLPDLKALYSNAFGQNLDSYSSDTKLNSRTDDIISLLCTKGSNGGHSLIGGKFDPILDGFVEGQVNEFERHGRQPDLINTCKRVVLDQTSFDLGPCQTWIKLATFVYNNKTDYFSPKASIEYSYIYVPAVWTMLSTIEPLTEDVAKTEMTTSSVEPQVKVEESTTVPISDPTPVSDPADLPAEAVAELETGVTEVSKQESDDINAPAPDVMSALPAETGEPPVVVPDETKLSELKVTDLKSRLDQLDVKYKSTAKKSELVSLLQSTLLAASEAKQVEESQAETENNLEPQVESMDTNQDNDDTSATLNQDSTTTDNNTDEVTEPKPEESKPSDIKKDLEDGELGSVGSDDTDQMECDKTGEVASGGGEKRKLEDDEAGEKSAATKKTCTDKEKAELATKAFTVYSSVASSLSLFSLYNATRPSRHDQFELTVASTILKETLIQHFSEYIFTCLVEDYRERKSSSSPLSSNPSSQEQQQQASDKNNNSSQTKVNESYKTPSASQKTLYPIGRYINLAFSYFDAAHVGYLQFDDLSKLFNTTGLTISKRALTALTSDTDTSSSSTTSSASDKFNYLSLPDLSPSRFAPTHIYQYPDQFRSLHHTGKSGSGSVSSSSNGLVEFNGVAYDIEKLVQQVKESEAVRVSLYDRFNYAIENSDKQAEEIHVLEVNQKSLSNAIKTQNDEICELKKERDNLKKKLENLRKGIKGTITSLTDLNKAAEDKS